MLQFTRKLGHIGLALILAVLCIAAPHQSLAQSSDCSTSTNNTPCFGPKSGSLTMDATSIAAFASGVNTSDFIATATFTNPYNISRGGWDYGIFFRRIGNGEDYRLVVRSNLQWELDYGDSQSALASGKLPNGILDTTATGKNGLVLIVSGNDGLFFVNNTYIGYLDVSAHTDAGDVEVVTSVFTNDYVKGGITPFKNFTVWASPMGGGGSGGSTSGGV